MTTTKYDQREKEENHTFIVFDFFFLARSTDGIEPKGGFLWCYHIQEANKQHLKGFEKGGATHQSWTDKVFRRFEGIQISLGFSLLRDQPNPIFGSSIYRGMIKYLRVNYMVTN